MGLYNHAVKEMMLAGWLDSEDEMQKEINKHILHMVEEFEKENHSGFSANYVLNALDKLLKFKCLFPLTGEEEEWREAIGEEGTQQNKRMSTIFRDKNGQAYNIKGITFRDQNGRTFTNIYSMTPVEFPYYPKEPQIIDIYDPLA